jgi:hypothetical protein
MNKYTSLSENMINLINNYCDDSIQTLNKILIKTKLKQKSVLLKSHLTLWNILTMCVIDGVKGFFLYKDCYQETIDILKKMAKQEKILEQIIIKDDYTSTNFILKKIDQNIPITDLLWIDCFKCKTYTEIESMIILDNIKQQN